MHKPRPTNPQRFRIALALAASKLKPANQSTASYILDLCDLFPLKSTPASGNHWRNRALVLEEEITTLKRKLLSDDAELCALRATTCTPASSAVPPATHQNSAVKKKRRKVIPNDNDNSYAKTDLDAVIKDLDHTRLPAIEDLLHIFSSYKKMAALTFQATKSRSRFTGESVSPGVLISTTAEMMEGLGGLLATILPPSKPVNPLATLKALDTILSTTMTSAFSLLPPSRPKPKTTNRHTALTVTLDFAYQLDRLFSVLTSHILAPLLRSFATLSLQFVSSLLQPSPAQKPNSRRAATQVPDQPVAADLRPDLLALLRRLLAILKEHDSKLLNRCTDVQQFIALEAAREINDLWPPKPEDGPLVRTAKASDTRAAERERVSDISATPEHRSTTSHTRRLDRLARKDTLWYLCAVLHDVLPSPMSAESLTATETLMQERTVEILNSLCFRSTGQFFGDVHGGPRLKEEIDEVEKGMIMAVLEKAWLVGLGGA